MVDRKRRPWLQKKNVASAPEGGKRVGRISVVTLLAVVWEPGFLTQEQIARLLQAQQSASQ